MSAHQKHTDEEIFASYIPITSGAWKSAKFSDRSYKQCGRALASLYAHLVPVLP